MMRSQVTRFVRVGSHLINLEAVLQVKLLKGGSALLMLQGPHKSMQRIQVPEPAGQELWEYLLRNMAVMEFGEVPAPLAARGEQGAVDTPGGGKAKKPKGDKQKAKGKQPRGQGAAGGQP